MYKLLVCFYILLFLNDIIIQSVCCCIQPKKYTVCVWAICEPLEKKVSRCVTLYTAQPGSLSLCNEDLVITMAFRVYTMNSGNVRKSPPSTHPSVRPSVRPYGHTLRGALHFDIASVGNRAMRSSAFAISLFLSVNITSFCNVSLSTRS